MKLQSVFFLVVLLAVQACDEKSEPNPEPETFLTVTLSADHNIYNDMWAFATDETGKVLDAHPVSPGQSVSLKTLSPPELINLTIYYNGGGSPVNHMFHTYAGISRGEEIRLESGQTFDVLPSVTGKANISVQNCSPYAFFNLSDGFSYSQFVAQSNSSIDALLDLRQEKSSILISSHKTIDEPVYGWLDNVTNAGVYTMDFNNLTPFPKNISILFSESMSALIVGRNAGVGNMGYVMANRGFSTSSTEPTLAKFGYLDGFDEYRVFVASTTATPTYYRHTTYTKRGSALPQEITFPDNSLVVGNPSIGNFSFTYSSEYTYLNHYWRQDTPDHRMHWRIFTDKATTPSITELPEAFTIKYPSLSISNLTYSNSDFYKDQAGYTYADFLTDIFAGLPSGTTESFGDSFQQK